MESPELDKQICQIPKKSVLLALGANISGNWGEPEPSLRHAVEQLVHQQLIVEKISPVYRTKAHGAVRQRPYLNIALVAHSDRSPIALLRSFKDLERAAGRRSLGRNAPRPLDVDLIDYEDRVINWPPRADRPKLMLPHPLMSERAFVLAPLMDIAPNWRHPVLGRTPSQMLRELGGLRQLVRQGQIKRLDSPLFPCDL